MSRKIPAGWIMIFVFLAFGVSIANAQTTADKKNQNWKITVVKRSGGITGGTWGSSLDSNGNLGGVTGSEETRKISEADLKEVAGLIEKLDLPNTKTKTVKGLGIYDGIYKWITITLDGKEYKVEGTSFYNEQQADLTAEQKETLEKLKSKLDEITSKTDSSDKKIKSWSISYSRFVNLREGGRRFSLDSSGKFENLSKNNKTSKTVAEPDLQEIVKLLKELNLPRTKTETVKGKKIYDYPYWSFTITLDGKSYLMEGLAFDDAKLLVLTAKQKQIFAKLNEKLTEFGAVR